VRIGRAAATGCVSGAESAVRHDRTDCLVQHQAAVGDVHTTWDTDLAGVIGSSFAGVHAAFCAVAGVATRHQVPVHGELRICAGLRHNYLRVLFLPQCSMPATYPLDPSFSAALFVSVFGLMLDATGNKSKAKKNACYLVATKWGSQSPWCCRIA
jgi:hypothetical protein